jgi:lysophospholipase L1-like esterase
LADIFSYEVLQKDLANPDNPVVLLHLVADVYAHKISKPFVTEEMYVNNIGQILSQLADANKIVYLGLIPHVQVGSFIPSGELDEINQRIDVFNGLLVEIATMNGYQDISTATWVDLGVQIIEQDGIRLWVHTVQPGPDLAILSDTKLGEFYARDGLHYHPDGYNLIGQAWAEALKAPVRATKYISLEQ